MMRDVDRHLNLSDNTFARMEDSNRDNDLPIQVKDAFEVKDKADRLY